MFLSPQGLKKECLLGGGGVQSVSLTHRAREMGRERESHGCNTGSLYLLAGEKGRYACAGRILIHQLVVE